MRIIIVGCGKVGCTVIESLAREGHDVTAIDSNPDTVAEVSNIYDIIGVCGNGADCDTLNEAEVSKADMLIAVTASDELNMLSCFLAGKMGAKKTIARIRNPEYNDSNFYFLKNQLGLATAINPEKLCARELYNILKLPSAASVESFSRRSFEMIEIRLKPDSKLDGMSLIDMRKKYPGSYLVSAVQRGDMITIPDGNFVLLAGDKIGLVCASNEAQKLLRSVGMLKKQAKSVMILGASKIGFYLAKMLSQGGHSVKIIDKDRTRCEEIVPLLPGVVVICGDGASQEMLLEEGLDTVDAFVALTGMDEQNILISIFASNHNVSKVITKVSRSEFVEMAEKLGLECIVSPRKTVSDVISAYARALQNSLGSNVEILYKLMGGEVEALEFNVQSDFKYTNIPFRSLSLKKNILIAGIIRGKKIIIPSGNDVIEIGDKVVVIASGVILRDLADIIK